MTSGGSRAPDIAPPPVPAGPPGDMSASDIAAKTAGASDANLRLSAGMTPLQKRSYIAAQAASGNPFYKSPEANAYGANLLANALMTGGDILPIEKTRAGLSSHAPQGGSAMNALNQIYYDSPA